MSDSFQPPDGFRLWTLLEDFEARGSKERKATARRIRLNAVVPFMTLPRSRRRDLTASLAWRIRTDPNGAGVFRTRSILPGSREWPLFDENGQRELNFHADFRFLSQRPLREGVFFNAWARTATMIAAQEIENLADETIEAQIAPDDAARAEHRIYAQSQPDGGMVTIYAPDAPLDSLGGLTAAGAKAAWLRARWDVLESLVTVHPHAALDYGYARGIGLHVVTDLPTVDTETLPRIIARFRDAGEQAYRDGPMDLAAQGGTLRHLLETTLYHWDLRQAESEGAAQPEPSETVRRLGNYQSLGIRLSPKMARQFEARFGRRSP